MKSLVSKVITHESCGRIILITSLAILFIIGINFNKQFIPETSLILIITILLPFNLIAFFAKIYWSFYFWTQYTAKRKFAEILKITFYTFLISLAAFPTIKIIYLLGLK